MVTEKIRKTILDKKLINKGEHIIVGLSGGPDSVCLFHNLLTLSGEMGFSVSAVHVNHMFRKGDAEEDQKYAEALCGRYGIECRSFVIDCNMLAKEKGISSEEAGRMARYGAFYDIAKKLIDNKRYDNVKIAVAHNLNDQAETVLMRIIRGTGTDGLAGIEYSRPGKYGTQIIRPLLDVSRNEIEEYCAEQNLNPKIDRTNSEPVYTRNKIRLNLIPKIEQEFNANFTESLNRLSKIAKEDKEYFDGQVEEAMEQAAFRSGNAGVSFSLEYLKNMHAAIRHRVIRRAFETIGLDQGITASHIEAADRIIDGASDSAAADFPKGYAVGVSYGEVRFFRNDPVSMGYVSEEKLEHRLHVTVAKNTGTLKDISLNGTRRFAALDLGKLLAKSGQSAAGAERQETGVDCGDSDAAERVKAMLQVRTRRQGDWIAPLGMGGTKKIQDLFVNEKVYKECRDKVPMVCIGDEVIWIVGDDVSGYDTGMKRGRVSENYKLEKDTQNIVILEFLKNL